MNLQKQNKNPSESTTQSQSSVHKQPHTPAEPPRVIPPKIDFAVGGQAVIEGVMMRSPNFITVAVRKPKGDITVKDEPFQALALRMKFFGIPILRGVINLFEMMVVGMKILNYSATQALDDEDQAASNELQKTPKASDQSGEKETVHGKIYAFLSFGLSLVFALGMSLFLFKFLPLYCTDLLSNYLPALRGNYLIYNFVDGIIKMTFFIVYIGLIGMAPSMKRVFQYHGAEHKSIYTYEKGLELTVQNAKTMTRFHPRCGTSFILVVFLLSIFIYTFIPKQPVFWVNFLTRVAFLPLIAGVSYELLKWSAKHAENPLVRWITLPGLLFQRITTKEPDESQLEVALRALRKALELENQKLATVTLSNCLPFDDGQESK